MFDEYPRIGYGKSPVIDRDDMDCADDVLCAHFFPLVLRCSQWTS